MMTFETIRKSSDSLLTIINNILDFSKIEAGKLDLEQRPFSLRESVEDAVRTALRCGAHAVLLNCAPPESIDIALPIVAAVATDEPEIAAKIPQESIVATASPPGQCPTQA